MRKHFDFYAYCSPTSGKYYIDGNEYFYGEDFRTRKRYREYAAAGFNMLLLQHENSYGGEDFASSACNLCMTEAYKAGIKRIIVSDTRIKQLCVTENLVGEGGKFPDEDSLCDALKGYIAPYSAKAGFYGLQLADEPEWQYLKSHGTVVRCLKKIRPDIYLQCNLLDIVEAKRLSPEISDEFAAYEDYLLRFLSETGSDSICFDEYPFRKNYILGGYSLPAYQIVGKVCRERGLEFRTVLQSFSWLNHGGLVHRRVTEKDMYWQINLAMGFGCKEYSFFTYFTKPQVVLKGGIHTDGVDGAAFINRDGTRTRLYCYTRRIISEVKRFEKVLLPYRYRGSYLFFEKGKSAKDFMQTEYAFAEAKCDKIEVSPDRGVVLVTELKSDDSLMFMIENIGNIKDEIDTGRKTVIKADLNKLGGKIKFYFRGRLVKRKIVKGILTETLSCGDALFLTVKDTRQK